MRDRIGEIIRNRVGNDPDAARHLVRRTVIRAMQDGQDQAVDTLMSGGTDYAIEVLARVYEARWIDTLERDVDETLTTLETART